MITIIINSEKQKKGEYSRVVREEKKSRGSNVKQIRNRDLTDKENELGF